MIATGAGSGAERAIRAIAARLASPDLVRPRSTGRGWWPQSLAHGAAGIALLHVDLRRTGSGSRSEVHAWLASAAAAPLSLGRNSGLYYGAPAVGFAMAALGCEADYPTAREVLERRTAELTRHRLARASDRIRHGRCPALAEFDVIRGLTGLGAYHLRHHPEGELLPEILGYVASLTRPLRTGGEALPGWWTEAGPSGHPARGYPGGHANVGMAHGVAGPLALLSLSRLRGIEVPEHAEAIARICQWLDQWQRGAQEAPWWPAVVTREQLRGEVDCSGPPRPSWCYGTPGLARALQLAGMATGDRARQQLAERALAGSLADQDQLRTIGDGTLCHGWAGLFYVTTCVAADARSASGLARYLPELRNRLLGSAGPMMMDPGLLEGEAGVGLALRADVDQVPSTSGWEACLLVN